MKKIRHKTSAKVDEREKIYQFNQAIATYLQIKEQKVATLWLRRTLFLGIPRCCSSSITYLATQVVKSKEVWGKESSIKHLTCQLFEIIRSAKAPSCLLLFCFWFLVFSRDWRWRQTGNYARFSRNRETDNRPTHLPSLDLVVILVSLQGCMTPALIRALLLPLVRSLVPTLAKVVELRTTTTLVSGLSDIITSISSKKGGLFFKSCVAEPWQRIFVAPVSRDQRVNSSFSRNPCHGNQKRLENCLFLAKLAFS